MDRSRLSKKNPAQNAHARSGSLLHSLHHLYHGVLTGDLITPNRQSYLYLKAFFIIFQSFKFDGSVEDVEVCEIV